MHTNTTTGIGRIASRPFWRSAAGTSTVQAAIVLPFLLILIFGVIQTVLYYNARNVAGAAAQAAVRYARAEQGSTGDGTAAARRILRAGGTQLAGAKVSVSRGATTSTATVTAHVASVVPFFVFPDVVAHAQGPVERATR